ncbi:hypothetical protein [Phreatobacter sp.]|uniref:hypothetical protein n=1 Tax=Phreatobacter sp. TaxID=1966341 RepID=UPI0025CE5FCF|nr:hypothetical protein [Phreatobacter sp.]
MRLARPALAALFAMLLSSAPVSPAQAEGRPSGGGFGLALLSPGQHADVMKRVESYAQLETFLKACGRPPALESRFRRLVRGCIEPATVNTLAQHFRRALAVRAHYRWDCVSASGRQMIARSEEAIRTTVADVTRLCQIAR